MFKHEDHDDEGRAIGPVWVRDENAESFRNFRDSDMEKSFGDERFFAAWFDLKTARQIAEDHGLSLEEA